MSNTPTERTHGSLCFTSMCPTLPPHPHTCFFLEEAQPLMPPPGMADTKLPHGARSCTEILVVPWLGHDFHSDKPSPTYTVHP